MMIMPKSKKSRRAGILAALAVVVLSTIWWLLRDLPSSTADTTTDDVERHFQKLGIVKLRRIPPPEDLVLTDLKGRQVRLSDFTGKVVFLNFWTTWCPECRIEMPAMEKLYQHFKDRAFIMLAVSLREPGSKVSQFFKREKLNFTALLDGDGRVGRRFGIYAIPTTIIIDQGGAMIGKGIGSRSWDSPAAKAFLEHLIEHPPEQGVPFPK